MTKIINFSNTAQPPAADPGFPDPDYLDGLIRQAVATNKAEWAAMEAHEEGKEALTTFEAFGIDYNASQAEWHFFYNL